MKHFPILDGRCYVVELPEGATNPEVHTRSLTFDTPMEVDEWGYDYQSVKLPAGNWQIVGSLSEVTEEQCRELVTWDGPYKFFTVDTLAESLESAIEHEGYSFSSPEFPDINSPEFYDEPYDGTGFYQELYSGSIEDYHKAQSLVLCRERTLILRRVDQSD